MTDATRGVIFPGAAPRLTRALPDPALADLVAWYWIPEWELADGTVSRQLILPYPACNLVVDPSGVVLSGPATRLAERELTGRGWAVGALLRPAATATLPVEPAASVDRELPLELPDLHDAVCRAFAGPDRHDRAVAAFDAWWQTRRVPPTPEAELAGRLTELLMSDSRILRVEDAAAALAASARTLQRVAHRYLGVPPSAMIRRRRLQEAAQRIREHPDEPLAGLAAELGYTDQAHLANDFRTVLGFTPSAYRRDV
ncbi:helix-turn-helix domain-containing protein [Actinopolymorpha alba]|uniref:helix-turn-helix domain-containing protein n=1 Tax=Actinopolymorpha alba TaxID=533267 RepID=UPI00039EB0C0|nr:helix-turn-helix domain-containing protein [Actinopolymorpha alba]